MSYQPEEIKALVRQAVLRTLGQNVPKSSRVPLKILHAETMQQMPIGSEYHIEANTIVTPLAHQIASERRIKFLSAENDAETHTQTRFTPQLKKRGNAKVIAIGADHGGYALKELLLNMLNSDDFEYTLVDCGTFDTQSVDYPDFAYVVARLVAAGSAWRGIIVDGAGIGSCMTANKVPGVRAAMCYDQATAVNSREHNNANVLTLGAGLIGANLAKQIVATWLITEFGGGRHARRVDKIDQLDRRFQR